MVCRFYGYTLEEVRGLTINEFSVLSLNISAISKLENPTEEDAKRKSNEKALPLSRSALESTGLVKKKPKKGKLNGNRKTRHIRN